MRRLRWFALLWLAALVLVTGCKSDGPDEGTMVDDPEATSVAAGEAHPTRGARVER